LNYYNENDPKAAQWLRELIYAGHIPAGDVDERSILDVKPYELTRYTQQHFFAGIGGWSLALKLAGWPKDKPVRTGSCPCQPFSIGSTKRIGKKDTRHLWPIFRDLITFGDPTVTFGEQVAEKDGIAWMDEVQKDLEGRGYAVGTAILPACAYGANHQRKRQFWVAYASSERWKGRVINDSVSRFACSPQPKSSNQLADSWRFMEANNVSLLPEYGLSVGVVRSALKGFGNAIVPQVAAEFIQAACESFHP
jgi:DNA (cytosine-5)-methyltransferase 1